MRKHLTSQPQQLLDQLYGMQDLSDFTREISQYGADWTTQRAGSYMTA